jgi:hypothetical protein
MNGSILAIAAVAGGLSLAAPAAYGHVTNAAAGVSGANTVISSSASIEKVRYRRARRAYGVRRYYGGYYGGRRVWVYPSYVWNGGPYLYYSTAPVAAAPVVVPAPVVAAPIVAPAPVVAAPVVAAPTYYQPVVAPTLLPVTPF